MEGHKNMGEKIEILNNIVIGGVGEHENNINSVGDNTGGGATRAEPDSLHGRLSERRKSKRHNVYQIQELETIFKENPHPDEKARLEIETKLSMNSKQVKSWFLNRRTREQLQWKHYENGIMKQENDKLRIEQIVLKEATKNPICKRCNNGSIIRDVSIDDNQLKIENNRLQDEVKRINLLADKLLGPLPLLEGSMAFMMKNSGLKLIAERNDFGGINVVDVASPMWIDIDNGLSSPLSIISSRPTISLANEVVINDKSKLMNLAFAAMNELLKLAKIGEPLWVRSLDGGGETLNLEEYARLVTPFIGIKPAHFTTEATRASSIVINNSQTLVETLMDKSEWVNMFSCIIGNTSIIDVISTGIDGSRSGTLLLIKAELQIISELVSVREIKFLRFCKQYAKDIWAIVDVSIDTIQEDSQQCETENYRRLPSGCIVQDMSHGYSKVIWIEHMEYNENSVHPLYRPLVKSGLGFGAQRWVATLQRQSEFSQMMMSFIDPTICYINTRSIGMLAQRMTRNFCSVVCATNHKWKTIQLANGEDARLMIRNNIGDPGEPIGVILSATKTIWLPVEQQRLFELFMNEKMRSQWDVLSNGGPMQQMFHISKGQNYGNSISLFHAKGDSTSANQNNIMIFQDTFTDATGSLLVYATIDPLEMHVVKNEGDSSWVALLPYGVAIVPDCFQKISKANNCNEISEKNNNGFYSGSLVTIGFQILVNNLPSTKFSMESAKKANILISRMIHSIKATFKCK